MNDSSKCRCYSCGDTAKAKGVYKGAMRSFCKECFDEIFKGKIPKLDPIDFGLGSPNGKIEQSEMAYHGGRFHDGEW